MIPLEVERLLQEREEARIARDFARADALREQISGLGFEVRDTPQGGVATPKPRFETVDPATITDRLGDPAQTGFSVHLLYEGFPGDAERFLAALEAHCAQHDYEVILVDNASGDGEALEDLARSHRGVRVLHLGRELGWAEARNAGLAASRGALIVIADLSVEPEEDVLARLEQALTDPVVGVAGPFGLVSDDLREFADSAGPSVDAIEGYLMATRRDVLARGPRFDAKFRWYRTADIDVSFQIRAEGFGAAVAPCRVRKHTHRGWNAVPDEERAKRSKRNFYRFLDRWRHRTDLLISKR